MTRYTLLVLVVVLLPQCHICSIGCDVEILSHGGVELAECDQPSSAVMEASELSSVITKTGSVGDIEVIYINNTYQISSSQ